jgi:CHAT domain-containing protein
VAGELLALGAPDFAADCRTLTVTGRPAPDEVLAVPAEPVPEGSANGDHDARDRLAFSPLPAAAQEVAAIVALWHEVRSAPTATVAASAEPDDRTLRLVGRAANEAAFKHFAPEYRALHVATHGFFCDRQVDELVPGRRGVGGLVPAAGSSSLLAGGENPMLLTGLALAGANAGAATEPGSEDGLLTAAEIAALDLSGVDWVVLSACESGVGVTQAGEGVLGLRRAFRIAGARTLVISLWPLGDDDMRDWMLRLYEEHLTAGLDLPRATWSASRTILAERRAAGLDTHPHTWAGFIACGD